MNENLGTTLVNYAKTMLKLLDVDARENSLQKDALVLTFVDILWTVKQVQDQEA